MRFVIKRSSKQEIADMMELSKELRKSGYRAVQTCFWCDFSEHTAQELYSVYCTKFDSNVSITYVCDKFRG